MADYEGVDVTERICSVDECTTPAMTRGWCQKHYTRWKRSGSPTTVLQIHGNDEARMASRFQPDKSGCWVWQGHLTPKGYGQVRIAGKARLAHRVMYEMRVGAVPVNLDLDHLCRNRACVNPDHLEPVTHQENLLRGETITARNAAVTHCPQGHEYTADNTYVPPTGGRRCRICRADARRRTRLKLGR